ncbi:hypothetical protein [Pseudoclavibacter sp. VKM Ac-2867]|uniref:hypothetical protein n=1 Tax=Pseudoclavibacter sp. VKM Ac-2867 TaxID=2783829 RepID=UPI00188BFEBB|nr:hypothetical protein [Pseudoclavibacter sp. VKM Ac-2867]MBF4459499.1 hypothetical protein [Pseudoclavibacter sp. VKM Ac-2867]
MTHATTTTPETQTAQLIPVQIRELYREFKRKPNVYGSRFELPEAIEAETPDGRKVRILGIQVKEGCHERRFCLGHVYVNWTLQSGAFSDTVYATGPEPATSEVRRTLEGAFDAAIAYLETVESAEQGTLGPTP